MNLDILKSFGLGENDIQVYGALFSLGISKTGPIIRSTSISSSRVYESLHSLSQKGLVSHEVKNNIKYYKAEVPNDLIAESQKNTEALKQLTGELDSLAMTKQDRNDTNTYEGAYGFRRAFSQHVDRIGKDEEVCVIAFSNHTVTKSRFTATRNMFAEIDKGLFSKTKNVRMLLDKRLYPVLKRDRKQFASYAFRFLPPGYFSPTAVNISKHEVMLSVWGPQPTVFTMRNPVIVDSFKKNFDFLWNLAKSK